MLRFRSLAVVTTVTLAVACQANQANQPMTDAARSQVATEIRAAADSAMAAFNRLDADAFLQQLSDVRFYAENTMVYPDVDSLARAVRGLTAAAGSIDLQWVGEPVVLVLAPDAGVVSGPCHETFTDRSGATTTYDGAWTIVYQRIGGAWKIVASHESYAPTAAPEGT